MIVALLVLLTLAVALAVAHLLMGLGHSEDPLARIEAERQWAEMQLEQLGRESRARMQHATSEVQRDARRHSS